VDRDGMRNLHGGLGIVDRGFCKHPAEHRNVNCGVLLS